MLRQVIVSVPVIVRVRGIEPGADPVVGVARGQCRLRLSRGAGVAGGAADGHLGVGAGQRQPDESHHEPRQHAPILPEARAAPGELGAGMTL